MLNKRNTLDMTTLTKAYHYAHASDEIRQSTLFSLKYHGGIIFGGLSEIYVSINWYL